MQASTVVIAAGERSIEAVLAAEALRRAEARCVELEALDSHA